MSYRSAPLTAGDFEAYMKRTVVPGIEKINKRLDNIERQLKRLERR